VLPYEVMSDQREIKVSVAPFTIDRFEVSHNRFYQFRLAYDRVSPPQPGAGEQPHVRDSGWKTEWTKNQMLVPPTASSLAAGIAACANDAEGGNEPIGCVTWYVAFAFCIWDGGRLPSESEWTFAAMGGDAQLPYPWSAAKYDARIDRQLACYRSVNNPCSQPSEVGSYPRGAAHWGTQDMAGNIAEWVYDGFREDLGSDLCAGAEAATCAANMDSAMRVIKGGSYGNVAESLLNAHRSAGFPEQRHPAIGFRCVRDESK
jgi:formylglycine-generating enzyme required for sulfatase activity